MQKIYKIRVPSTHTEFTYYLGQEFKLGNKDCKVCEIERDTNNYYLLGSLRYTVWVETKAPDLEKIIFRVFEGLPVDLTYEV